MDNFLYNFNLTILNDNINIDHDSNEGVNLVIFRKSRTTKQHMYCTHRVWENLLSTIPRYRRQKPSDSPEESTQSPVGCY